MAIRLPGIIRWAVLAANQLNMGAKNVPKGHLTVYVGETYEKKPFVVPIEYRTILGSKTCYVRLRRNSDSVIQWVALPFHAPKTHSFVTLLIQLLHDRSMKSQEDQQDD